MVSLSEIVNSREVVIAASFYFLESRYISVVINA
jgi:hypothetical protein